MSDSLCFPLLSGAMFLIIIARVSGRREHLLPEGTWSRTFPVQMGITRREGSQNIQRHKPDREAVMRTIRRGAVSTECVPAAGMQAAVSSPNQACVSPSKPQARTDGELE